MTSQNSYGCGPEDSQTSQTSLDNLNQTLSPSPRTGSTSQDDGRVSSTGLSGSDHIYPIRSLVSMKPVNASPSPALKNVEESLIHPEDPPISTIDGLPEARLSHNSVSVNDEMSSNTPATGDFEDTGDAFGSLETAPQENQTYMTSRFEHAFSEHGHTVLIGDSKKSLKRCEDEPSPDTRCNPKFRCDDSFKRRVS
jgi:hypothetical protein